MAAPLGGSIAVNSFVDSAGPNQPFFAPASGGGGGGGGGPNPVVSTLTVNPTGQILSQAGASTIGLTSYAGEMNDGKFYPGWLTTDGGTNTTSVFTGQVGFQGAGVSQSGEVYACIRGGNTNDFGVTTLIADCRGFQIQNSGGPTFLNVSSINVSSINGAQPGGGGTSTPDPVFSSITLSTTGAISAPGSMAINVGGVLGEVVINNLATGGITDIVLGTNAPANSVYGGWNTGSANLVNINSPSGLSGMGIGVSDENGAVISMSVNNPGPVSTFTFNSQGNLNFLAPLTSISSLNVSSINGAAPGGGGGGPPPAVVSTISSFVNVSTINYGSPGVINVAGGMQVADFLGAGTISTVRVDSIVPGGAVAIPLAALSTVVGDVNMSTLTVSSINGASYPPPAGGMMFSSIGIPGGPGSAFNADPNVVTNVLTIPIIPNHVYSFDVNARVIANNAPTVTDTDNYYLEILANGGSTVALDTAWGVQISSLTSGSIFTEVGGSGILKAPANPVSTLLLNILGSFSTTTRVDSFSYIDFGPI